MIMEWELGSSIRRTSVLDHRFLRGRCAAIAGLNRRLGTEDIKKRDVRLRIARTEAMRSD